MDIQVADIRNDALEQPSPSAADSQPKLYLSIANRYIEGEPSNKDKQMLETIYNYAAERIGSSDMQDVIWEVINMEGRVGSPRLGENKFDRIYRYCQLRMQEQRIQNELKGLHGV